MVHFTACPLNRFLFCSEASLVLFKDSFSVYSLFLWYKQLSRLSCVYLDCLLLLGMAISWVW